MANFYRFLQKKVPFRSNFFLKFFYVLVNADSKISPNFMEIRGLFIFGQFSIAAPNTGPIDMIQAAVCHST
jgi:hypothetical protein